MTLDGDDCAVCVGNSLTLCYLTDHALAVLRESNDRRCGARAFGVRDNDGLAALHNGYAGIGCTQVNTDNFAHD